MSQQPPIIPTDLIHRTIADCSIGLALLSESEKIEDAVCAGSGSLVTIGSVHGILTAAHVLDSLPKKGKVGVVLLAETTEQFQKQTITMEHTEAVLIRSATFGEDGPDLGFMRLPPENVGWLKAKNSFYNLVKRREDVLLNRKPSRLRVDSITGMIHELTKDVRIEQKGVRKKSFTGIFCDARIVAVRWTDYFEVLRVEPRSDPDFGLPNSFQGTSGGSLWRFFLREENGAHSVIDRWLLGVPFYETLDAFEKRVIVCHGPKGIYESLINKVIAKWPDEAAKALGDLG